MKVVHIFWSLTFGGIETMLTNIANAQVQQGADVSVIIINDNLNDTLVQAFDHRVNFLPVHKKLGSGSPVFLVRFNRILQNEHPDVIHLHGSDLMSLIFSPMLKKKVCSTLHDVPHGFVRRRGILYRLFPILDIKLNSNVKNIDNIPKVFAISQEVHDRLLENYNVDSTVVCNGISSRSFKRRGSRKPSEPFRIVQVSRLEHDKKGQDLLIRAAANLKGRVTVDFIGTGSSEAYLRQLTEELNAAPWVHFLGQKTQDEIKESLFEYDLFAQPSRYEGFGLTVAEAMAAEVPVMVTAGEGTAEVTCGDKYGWTFENGNAVNLAEVIEWLVSNYDAATRKATAARQHVIDTYDVSITASRYLEEYAMLINTRRYENHPNEGGGVLPNRNIRFYSCPSCLVERRCA